MEPGGGAGLVPGGGTPDVQPLVPGEEPVLLTILHRPRASRAVPGLDHDSGNGIMSLE